MELSFIVTDHLHGETIGVVPGMQFRVSETLVEQYSDFIATFAARFTDVAASLPVMHRRLG